MTPFRMGTSSSITVQSLGEIVQRAQAVGAKIWCLYVFYRQDCHVAENCRYCFYSQAKKQVFRPAGATRCTNSGQTLQYLGPLGCAKFHVNRCRRMGMRPPKYQKCPLYGKESPRRGDSLDRFPKFLGAFIRLTILR